MNRSDFPMLAQTMHGHPLIYLDSAATSQKPQIVIDTMTEVYTKSYGTVNRAIYDLATKSTQRHHQTREKVQKFLGAKKSEEIIITKGTTEAINLVASSYGKAFLKPGNLVLVSAMEHHSNIVPWQIACENSGAKLKVIPIHDNGEIDLEAYKKLLEEKPKIVAVTHISNVLGTVNPIKIMTKWAHDSGAHILIDGAQAAPHEIIDVEALNVDFYTFSGHKVYGPTGIGVLYGKEALLDTLPPYQGGGDMIEKVTFEKTSYNTLPLKFEAGTPPIVEMLGLGAAIDYLSEIGHKKISAWEQKLLTYTTTTLQKIEGLKIYGESASKGPVISFSIKGVHPLDLGILLNLQGICIRTGHHCAQPLMDRFGLEAMARVSFGLYNTLEEIESLEKAIRSSLQSIL